MRIGEKRTRELQRRIADEGLDAFVLNDADSINYFGEFWHYLGMEFGRATVMVVPRQGEPILIVPLLEFELCRHMTWVHDVRPWMDGVDGEWTKPLLKEIGKKSIKRIGIEWDKTHAAVHRVLADKGIHGTVVDAWHIPSRMRMVKTPEEIQLMRNAGQVAVAMSVAGREAIHEGVPEYEVAIAVHAAGTRKAAEIIESEGGKDPLNRWHSPTIYNLQILNSGTHTCMPHPRSTVKRLNRGDPVYLCFCGIANFKNVKLGYDRQFYVSNVAEKQARAYETAVRAQQTALKEIKPGAIAADINAAAVEVYKSEGYSPSYRTGRGIGFSFLEEPQLKVGDHTKLQPGMTFAVDGGISVEGEFGARIGDSIVVTHEGFEYLTDYPRGLTVL